MNLEQWSIAWGVPLVAVQALRQQLLAEHVVPPPPALADKGEAYAQSVIRLEAPRYDCHLWRNQVGAFKERDKEGNVLRVVRFGLANDSSKLNEVLKSGDLIGWRKRHITHEMVGHVIAQFVSREAKRPGWVFNPNDPHERAQQAWNELVLGCGGDAAFATGQGSFQR